MLFLRLQSVFLSLVLYVILFFVLFYLIIGLPDYLYNKITSEEIFGYFLLFCFIPLLSFYGIFIIIGSILLLDICKVVKKHFCGLNDIFFYNYCYSILLEFLLAPYSQYNTFVNSNGFDTLSLYLFEKKRLENSDSCS